MIYEFNRESIIPYTCKGMEKKSEATPPHSAPKTPQQEAEALLEVLTHPKTEQDAEAAEAPETPAAKTMSVVGSTAKLLFSWLITPAAIVLVLHFFVFQAYQVVGSSMVPTLHNSDYLIISKVGPTFSKLRGGASKHAYFIPKRGEIAVFIAPPSPTQTFVKRVVGLPGDRVVVKDGKITVYDKAHPEGINPDATHQVSDPITLGNDDLVVPPGNLYVVGDNRIPGASFDSRDWGLLPAENIIGVAILRLLPISDLRLLDISLPLPPFLNSFAQLP